MKDNRFLAPGWVPMEVFADPEKGSAIGNQGKMLREVIASTDLDGVEGRNRLGRKGPVMAERDPGRVMEPGLHSIGVPIP